MDLRARGAAFSQTRWWIQSFIEDGVQVLDFRSRPDICGRLSQCSMASSPVHSSSALSRLCR
jgi:hypothetical protein